MATYYVGSAPEGITPYTTIAAAMNAVPAPAAPALGAPAPPINTIQIAAGNYNEPLTITKPNLMIVGAVDANGAPAVSIRGANNYSNTIANLSNITVKNIMVKKPSSTSATTYFMTHISGIAGLASTILFENVHYDSTESPTRGVSVNVANVTFKSCVFPATANFSLGIASSRGVVCENCVFKQSGWGTIGIFPTNQTITNQANISKETQSIDLLVGNSFVNASGTGPTDMGLIHVQPYSGANYGGPITVGLDNTKTVKLPDAFKYLYYNTAPHAGAVTVPGVVSMTAVNTREYFSLPAVQTALNAQTAGSVDSIYGKNLENGNLLVELGLKITTAIAAAVAGDVIDVAAGSYSGEQLAINKAITVKGAGMSQTTYTHTGNSWSVVMNKSGAILRDIKILKPHTNTASVISIARESRDVDSTGCKLINVEVGSSTATALARSVDINGVSDVTLDGCVFPRTSNSYSFGLASVKGIVVTNCTIPSSAWGSVGIFPTKATAYVGGALDDPSTSDVDLSATSNIWSGDGTNAGGVINIQPNSYASYELASEMPSSAAVTLPASFRYAYLQQARSAAPANANVGEQNVSISNSRFMDNAMIYALVQGAAVAEPSNLGGRVVMFGRDLADNNKMFFDTTFNTAENKAYAGINSVSEELAAAQAVVSGLTEDSTSAEKDAAADAAAAAAGAAVNTPSDDADVIAAALAAAKAAAEAAAAAGATGAVDNSLIASIEAANEAGKTSGNSNQKAAVATVWSGSSVTIPADNTTTKDAIFASLSTEKKPDATTIAALKNKEWEVSVPEVPASGLGKIYLPRSSQPSKLYYFAALGVGKEYELLWAAEGATAAETATPAGSKQTTLTYDGAQVIMKVTGESDVVLAPGANMSIHRNGSRYDYPVYITGSTSAGGGSTQNPCFPAGQRILTPTGWRAVEELRNGDMVITDQGKEMPAKIYSSSVRTNAASAPITIPAHVFGRNVPSAPVRLSPRHAVRMDMNTWQFPSNLLRMCKEVTQDAPGEKITYYHIALPNYLRDNLVLEGGVVAESYGAPFVKANGVDASKVYTFDKDLGGFVRMAPATAAGKSKSA